MDIHVSQMLNQALDELRANRDNELSMYGEVLSQYVTNHNNKSAYRENDRKVNKLAKAFDRMERFLERAAKQAEAIELSADNYYGD